MAFSDMVPSQIVSEFAEAPAGLAPLVIEEIFRIVGMLKELGTIHLQP